MTDVEVSSARAEVILHFVLKPTLFQQSVGSPLVHKKQRLRVPPFQSQDSPHQCLGGHRRVGRSRRENRDVEGERPTSDKPCTMKPATD